MLSAHEATAELLRASASDEGVKEGNKKKKKSIPAIAVKTSVWPSFSLSVKRPTPFLLSFSQRRLRIYKEFFVSDATLKVEF